MKQYFLRALLLLLPVILAGGFFYLVWHAFSSLYSDWKLKKELEEIRAESEARRKENKSDETS